MWRDLWAYRRRVVVVAALVLVALLAVAVGLAVTLGGGGRHRTAKPFVPINIGTASPSGSASGYDRGPWDAVPAVAPAASVGYPAIPTVHHSQPDVFAQAFGTELLTRDYRRSTRAQLLAWAQAESAPLTIVQVPLSDVDRSKALLVSLTNPAWDDTSSSIVPTQGQWLALAAQQAYTTVADVRVETVPDFPQPDTTFTEPTLDRLFTATVTLHTTVAGKPVTSQTSVAFEVVMTDHLGSFGAAETQHYVTQEMP